jgi:hypothetical protein
VVSERDHVGAGGKDVVGDPRSDPGAVRRVLAVDDAEADIELFAQTGQALLDYPAPRNAEDVGNEENLQGVANAAVGRTSISTWLPASCV